MYIEAVLDINRDFKVNNSFTKRYKATLSL